MGEAHAWWGTCMVGGGGHAWWGACMVGGMCGGGMHGRGVYAWQGGHAWQGGVWQGDICGRRACMAGSHVWQGDMCGGGMNGRGLCVAGGHACHAHHHPPGPSTMRYGRSMHGQYASYWNAFLFEKAIYLLYYSGSLF